MYNNALRWNFTTELFRFRRHNGSFCGIDGRVSLFATVNKLDRNSFDYIFPEVLLVKR